MSNETPIEELLKILNNLDEFVENVNDDQIKDLLINLINKPLKT